MSQPTASGWRAPLTSRSTVLAIGFACWSVAIVARLVFLQVLSYDEMVLRAESQYTRVIEAPAKRGEIYDRNGRLLAFSVDADSIYAVPAQVGDAPSVAAKLCGVLAGCDPKERTALADRLGRRQRAFVYVKRRVSPAEAQSVAALGLAGVGFTKESKRFYPNREVGAHLIGYAGLDNVGLGGVEAAYDKVVRGREGKLLVQTDARGKAFNRLERAPTSGGSIELTIDAHLQY
ncbi:MAG TPA: hypothetical protein VM820_04385, partial [Vicinamibacterales bacterium]|nr:hypothetical protein [Vicinamibacterales bacterium]